MNKFFMPLTGAVTGLLNGFFGSGGGAAAVPMLRHGGLETKAAHASALALTLPLSAVSAVFYLKNNTAALSDLPLLALCGLAGAVTGALCMKRIPSAVLSYIFGVLLVIVGARGLFA